MIAALTEGVIRILGSLKELRTLRLRLTSNENIRFPAGDNLYGELRNLEIASVFIVSIDFDKGAMKKLKEVILQCGGEPPNRLLHHGTSESEYDNATMVHCSSNKAIV